MALSAFDDKGHRPEAAELAAVLAGSAPLWFRLVTHLGESYPPITEEWGFTGAKYGWSLRLKRKDRVVLYLTPQAGRCLAGVVLGEKAVASALERGLSARAAAHVEAAPATPKAEASASRSPARTTRRSSRSSSRRRWPEKNVARGPWSVARPPPTRTTIAV